MRAPDGGEPKEVEAARGSGAADGPGLEPVRSTRGGDRRCPRTFVKSLSVLARASNSQVENDTEAARKMQQAKRKLFAGFNQRN